MKRFLLPTFLIPLSLLACSPTPPIPQPSPPPIPQAPAPVQAPAAPTPSPPPQNTPKHLLKAHQISFQGITVTAVTFDCRDFFLKVIDQKNGPGSEFSSAQNAAPQSHAVINGGFFTPEGQPLGLVITNGESRGALNTASFLGTGILDGKNLTLSTRTAFQRSPELLQSGPRLVWRGESLTGLSDRDPRPRSFLIWDGKNHFGLAFTDSATLLGLSQALQNQPIPQFQITHALNLDGGRSCDFWISAKVPGGPLEKKSFLNRKVRNYLALQAR